MDTTDEEDMAQLKTFTFSETFTLSKPIESLANIEEIYSAIHVFAGFEWRLKIYPRGNDEPSQLSVYLECKGPAEKTNGQNATTWKKPMCFRLILYGHSADTCREVNFCRDSEHMFTNSSPDWGFREFLSLEDVKSAKYMVIGKIRLGAALRPVRDYNCNPQQKVTSFNCLVSQRCRHVVEAPVRVAVLGFCREGYEPVLIDLANRGRVELVGFWEWKESFAIEMAEFFATKLGKRPYAFVGSLALDDLLARPDVDAIIGDLSVVNILRCIGARKHYLCLDMVSQRRVMSVEDALEIFRACEQQQSAAYFGALGATDFEPALRHAAREVRATCGQVLNANLRASGPTGEAFEHYAAEYIPLLQHVLGAKITTISHMRVRKSNQSPPTDTLNVILRFGCAFNASAAIAVGTKCGCGLHITVCGTQGRVEVSTSHENGKIRGFNVTVRNATGIQTTFHALCGRKKLLEAFTKLCLKETPTDPIDLEMLSPEHAFAQAAIFDTLRTRMRQ